MIRSKKILFIIFIDLLFSINLFSQNERYEEIIIKDKLYKPGSAWFKIGIGGSYNLKLKTFEVSSMLSASFRIKDYYFQTGYHVSSDKFFIKHAYQKLNDFYIAGGFRRETLKSNICAFIGPSYAYGAFYHHSSTDSISHKEVLWYKGFNEIGLVTSIDYTYKIFYDLGIGASIYCSYNKCYSVVGIQAHVYFSGAFKGKIKEQQ